MVIKRILLVGAYMFLLIAGARTHSEVTPAGMEDTHSSR